MKDFWDQRYQSADYAYGIEPNMFFKERLKAFSQPGKILFPMEGEGRNAVHAARLGWDVHAFDYSEAGREKALRLAKLNDVSIDYKILSAENFKRNDSNYDVIVLIFAHLPSEIRKLFHLELYNSLRPGGLIILEAFNPSQLGLPSGGPKEPSLLYTLKMLENDFPAMKTIFGTESTVELKEGEFHSGPAQVVRWVAEKPV